MLRYIARRFLQMIPVLVGISLLTFMMIHLVPGDPVAIFAGDKPLTEERRVQIRHQLGLDRPLAVQYLDYAGRALRGDLGVGLHSQQPVLKSILDVLPYTVELAATALLIAVVLGMSIGILAAVLHGSWLETALMSLSIVGISMPIFYFGLLLIFLFCFMLGWFPATGLGGLSHLILPATALGMLSAAVLARMVRASTLDVLHEEYITTARAKGLAERAVLLRHAVRNALIPTVTMLGLQVGSLLGGAVVTETIFSRPGLGRLAIDAILNRDFPLVQGTVLFAAVNYVFVNLVVDISYAAIDPRIRYG
jgi:peptide/nickel transport system permease protein